MTKRTLLAIVLIGVVMVVWMWMAPKPATVPPKPADNATAPSPNLAADNGTTTTPAKIPSVKPAADNGTVPTPVPTPVTTPTPAPAPAAALYVAADQDCISIVDNLTLKNVHLTSRWTNRFTGACLNVTFADFYRTVKRETPMTLLGGFSSLVEADNSEHESTAMGLEFPELSKVLAGMKMRVASADDNAIVFVGKILSRDADGTTRDFLEVTKTVRPSPDAFEVLVEVSVKNLTGAPVALKYDLRVLEGITVEANPDSPKGEYASNAYARMVTLSANGSPTLKDHRIGKLDPPWTEGAGNVLWAGMDDRYFAALAWAESGGNRVTLQTATIEHVRAKLNKSSDTVDTARVKLSTAPATLAPGAVSDPRTYHLFVGPKRADVLDRYASIGLPGTVDYGMWGLGVIFATPILWLLRGAYFVVRNYGVAILVMTVVIRVLLHPLTKKGQVAMAKMQRLKPKITDLQKRFKNDRQKLAQEQMKLFREAGVSPMSGCLPMLLQMPILFALFSALRQAFELRQAACGLWIKDLSLPDTVGHFPASVPLFGGAAINLLPILMSAAMFVQQLMTPKAEDEQTRQQQKMMMFLPLVFVFMFYGFPSGLCLYWFSSTVIGIGEQWYIQRHIKETLDAPAKA